jgi:hypothetical protein
MQRAFRVFLRVLTVLFLTVALHHVNADAATRAFFQQVEGPAQEQTRGESINQMKVRHVQSSHALKQPVIDSAWPLFLGTGCLGGPV